MAISIQLPPEVEQDLRQRIANPNEAAKEAVMVEL
jgi:hypothetical protein